MHTLIFLLSGVLLVCCRSQTVCRTQNIVDVDDSAPMTLRLELQQNNFTRRRGPNRLPRVAGFVQRSIEQCKSSVEMLRVPDSVSHYEGVPLGGVVTIVESEVPLHESIEAAQRALPACTGIFVSPTQIISSAHCVFHHKQNEGEVPYWMFGDGNLHNTFLYAIAGKVDAEDDSFDVYKLVTGCIPQSYIDAENEEVTSSMGNDLVVFEVEGNFTGDPSAIGNIANSIVYDIPRNYLLPQYPSDVDEGRSLVIDMNKTPIFFEPLGDGVFFSIDLASWSGSSGGPIIDVNATQSSGRPCVVGVLMSSGWSVCDSGIVPVTTAIPLVQELLTSASTARKRVGSQAATHSDLGTEEQGADANVVPAEVSEPKYSVQENSAGEEQNRDAAPGASVKNYNDATLGATERQDLLRERLAPAVL